MTLSDGLARARAAWDRFWFGPGTARNLAAARIVLAAQALWILLSRDIPALSALPAAFWAEVPGSARWRFLVFEGRPGLEAALQAIALYANGDAIDTSIPMVVLVDHGSASASEIASGALRDTGRATIVGEKTFGKGVFQEVEKLQNGGLLKLTVGSYYLPKGETITRKGIHPQVKARDNPRTRRDEALPVALKVLLSQTR